ncbi:hypothetical protein, partial [Bartonella henselae]
MTAKETIGKKRVLFIIKSGNILFSTDHSQGSIFFPASNTRSFSSLNASLPSSNAQPCSTSNTCPVQPKAGFPTLLKTRQPFYSSSQVLLRTRSF